MPSRGRAAVCRKKKVTAGIAKIRGIPQGSDSLSPNRHHGVQDWDSLLDLIATIRDATGKPVGIKTVVGRHEVLDVFFDRIVAKGPDCAPDFITIDGSEGGIGAAPMPLIDIVGTSIREALPVVADLRNAHGLKDRI